MAEVSKEVAAIPTLSVHAGPRNKEDWSARVKEEYLSLISYIRQNKESDNDWCKLSSDRF